MVCNKKRLLLLLGIPCFCVFQYLLNHYLDYNYKSSDIVCFSAFIICASVILSTNSMIARAMCLLPTNICIVLLAVFKNSFIILTAQQLLIYCIFELPSLILLIMITDKRKDGNDELLTKVDECKPHSLKRGLKKFLNYRFFYRVLLFVLLIILLIPIITGKEPITIKRTNNSASFLFLLFFLLFLFTSLAFDFKQDFFDSAAVNFIVKLMNTSVIYFCINEIWAKQYSLNTVYLCLPLFLSTIVVFKHFNILAGIKRIIIKK